MTRFTKYTPEELAKRLEDIENKIGEPYQLGEDPLVDLAMGIQDTPLPQMSAETMAAMETALILGVSATNPPQLGDTAFNNIEAMLQTQMQLQSTTSPRMSDEAFNWIEQQLLNKLKPKTPLLSLIAVLIIGFAVVLSGFILLSDEPETLPEMTEDTLIDENVAEPVDAYTSSVLVVIIDTTTPEPTPEPIVEVEASPEALPEIVESEPDIAPTPRPTLINLADVMQLPAAVMIDGPITSLEDETLIIFNMTFTYDYDPILLDNYEVGDMVHIDGAENPYDNDTYLILNIEPVYVADADIDHPNVVSSISNDMPDTTVDDTNTGGTTNTSVITSAGTDSDNSDTAVTSGSTSETPPSSPPPSNDDECGDGSDANQGQGQECNPGQDNDNRNRDND